jgi:hypothetical protein
VCGSGTGSGWSSKMWAEVGTGDHEQWEVGDESNFDERKSSVFAKIATTENTPPVNTPKWGTLTDTEKRGQNTEPEMNYLRGMSIMDNNKFKDESEMFDSEKNEFVGRVSLAPSEGQILAPGEVRIEHEEMSDISYSTPPQPEKKVKEADEPHSEAWPCSKLFDSLSDF